MWAVDGWWDTTTGIGTYFTDNVTIVWRSNTQLMVINIQIYLVAWTAKVIISGRVCWTRSEVVVFFNLTGIIIL